MLPGIPALLALLPAPRPQAAPPPAAPALELARPAPATGIEVSYLGGEAFLFRSRAHSVLVDVFVGPDPARAPIPAEALAAMKEGQGMFDRVRVCIGTHLHAAEIFPAGAAARYVEARRQTSGPSTLFDGPHQVIERVRSVEGVDLPLPLTNNRWAKLGESSCLQFVGLRIDYLPLPHAGDAKGEEQHLGLSIRHAGVHVVHLVHAAPRLEDLERYQAILANPQLVIVPYGWLLDEGAKDLLQNRVAPRRVLVTGVPVEGAAELAPRLEAAFPGVIVPTKPLETFAFEPPSAGR
ncbi:MAG: hypothetical protein AB1726_00705 [Planctomycetota bacterium]